MQARWRQEADALERQAQARRRAADLLEPTIQELLAAGRLGGSPASAPAAEVRADMLEAPQPHEASGHHGVVITDPWEAIVQALQALRQATKEKILELAQQYAGYDIPFRELEAVFIAKVQADELHLLKGGLFTLPLGEPVNGRRR